MADAIVNRVAESLLEDIDLERFYPKEEVMSFDLKDFLFMELILKEKDFREALKQKDWSQFQDKVVAVHCSTDAIIPMWAYMLIGSYLQPVAKSVYYGSVEQAIESFLMEQVRAIDTSLYNDKRVVIKGCGDKNIGEKLYLEITLKLRPVVKSLMYGEPCSTVPVFKKSIHK